MNAPKKRTPPTPAEEQEQQQEAGPEQPGGVASILKAMTDAPAPPAAAAPRVLLEGISGSEHQQPIEVPVMPPPRPVAAKSRRRAADAPEPPAAQAYKLPRGAQIALRRSGGLRFSSLELVVYRDGQYLLRRTAPAPRTTQKHQLGAEQLTALQEAVASSGLETFQATGKHNPDGYAYELAARLGRRAVVVELFDGSIPPSVEPLLRQLTALLRLEE